MFIASFCATFAARSLITLHIKIESQAHKSLNKLIKLKTKPHFPPIYYKAENWLKYGAQIESNYLRGKIEFWFEMLVGQFVENNTSTMQTTTGYSKQYNAPPYCTTFY